MRAQYALTIVSNSRFLYLKIGVVETNKEIHVTCGYFYVLDEPLFITTSIAYSL